MNTYKNKTVPLTMKKTLLTHDEIQTDASCIIMIPEFYRCGKHIKLLFFAVFNNACTRFYNSIAAINLYIVSHIY